MIAAIASSLIAQESDFMVYALPLAGFMLIFYGVYQVFDESRSSARRKMQSRLRGERRATENKPQSNILRRDALGSSKSILDAIFGKMTVTPKVQAMLDQADLDWSASRFITNLGVVSVCATIVLLFAQFNPVVAMGCGGASIVIPLFWLTWKRKRRQTKLAGQLPDVFELMSQALRAGHSLAGAVQLIYEQMPPPIAREFAQVYHEQNLGVKIEDSLQSMALRVESLDVKLFVTAVMIQRQTGGDLAEVLDNISGVIRERIELAGLVRSLTAEGRLSGWVLFALPMIVFVATLWMNPDYGTILLEDPRGQLLLMIAGGMQVMGIAMIRWIVNIRV